MMSEQAQKNSKIAGFTIPHAFLVGGIFLDCI